MAVASGLIGVPNIITGLILHYPQFVSMSVPCFHPIGHPTTKDDRLDVWIYAE
jgi:hypothetical protein